MNSIDELKQMTCLIETKPGTIWCIKKNSRFHIVATIFYVFRQRNFIRNTYAVAGLENVWKLIFSVISLCEYVLYYERRPQCQR